MPTLFFFLGSICVGIAAAFALLFTIASHFGATSQGEGVLVVLLGSGPLALGIIFYWLAWQVSALSNWPF